MSLTPLLRSLGAVAALILANALPASAEPRHINYTLSSQANQSFADLMQQAEALAGNLVDRAFVQSPSVTETSVTVVGERNGQEVPLLFSRVSRSNWQMEPRIKPWTLYGINSATLLGFLKPKVAVVQSVGRKPFSKQVAASMSDIEPNFYQRFKRR